MHSLCPIDIANKLDGEENVTLAQIGEGCFHYDGLFIDPNLRLGLNWWIFSSERSYPQTHTVMTRAFCPILKYIQYVYTLPFLISHMWPIKVNVTLRKFALLIWMCVTRELM